jgi:hypothetical protein
MKFGCVGGMLYTCSIYEEIKIKEIKRKLKDNCMVILNQGDTGAR